MTMARPMSRAEVLERVERFVGQYTGDATDHQVRLLAESVTDALFVAVGSDRAANLAGDLSADQWSRLWDGLSALDGFPA